MPAGGANTSGSDHDGIVSLHDRTVIEEILVYMKMSAECNGLELMAQLPVIPRILRVLAALCESPEDDSHEVVSPAILRS